MPKRKDKIVAEAGTAYAVEAKGVQELLEARHADIAAFCKRWHIARLEVFGSVLRDDFRPDSDLDFLYTAGAGFRRDLAYGPWAQNRMAEELSALLGREVDLVERAQIEKHRNWIRREHILSTARVLYVEG
jgi:predicted nucleotidyltransferase